MIGLPEQYIIIGGYLFMGSDSIKMTVTTDIFPYKGITVDIVMKYDNTSDGINDYKKHSEFLRGMFCVQDELNCEIHTRGKFYTNTKVFLKDYEFSAGMDGQSISLQFKGNDYVAHSCGN